MNKYYNFKAADFIDDPGFRDWVYGRPQDTAVDWQQLGDAQPSLVQEMDAARLFLESVSDEQPDVSDAYIQNFGDHIIRKHNEKTSPEARQFPIRWYKNPVRLLYMAATIFLAFGLGWYFLLSTNRNASEQSGMLAWLGPEDKLVNKSNGSTHAEIITLQDGSKITLQPNSSVTYPEVFDGTERNVQLQGEAFFEVKRNPKQPFLVHFNNLIVKVLGTSFNIRSFPSEGSVRVTVRTGKVAVLPDKADFGERLLTKAPRAVTLTANQEIFYKKGGDRFERAVAINSQIVNPEISEADFEFARTPLSDVLEKLEKAYGIPIIYDEDQVRDCSLTASLSDEPLLEKLKMICKTMDASYETVDGRIVMNVKSCRAAMQ
ncbi:FecR family protein [Dyadobacter sp. OTU695]|uniref:FecR family protein n=1 Tax=Dyadobacter sp. OTU695 TaxID=3043860 RepID=UPI00313DD79E